MDAKPEVKEAVAELKHFVRVANTDLEGKKQLAYSMRKVKGISHMFAHAVCFVSKIAPETKTGSLSEVQIAKLTEVILDPVKSGIPVWLVNRRHDYETGENKHVITTNLMLARENDIKNMKKMKCYKGVRHIAGLPVRGHRTRSHFRANKGKVHLGVKLSAGAKKGGKT